ncbi:ComEA family DNA-binding protein [Dyella sp. ASV21]|jgi:competence protein ComEA|uniref:ComEA family DNA-binding protein n=1 Tax=Dyella sp. ASV21 TaxID=2795114 RepID=UPI0018EB5B9A|nr:ComEA family DNA-binding protein [Dyella sp. ASV21]
MRHLFAALLLTLTLALPAWASTPVNINTADAAAIAHALDGVGPSKAAAIVAWREAHGPFKSVEDLGQVKGIGPATLERNRTAIQLSDAAGAEKAPGKPAAAAAATAAPAKTKPNAAKAAHE